MLYRLETKGTKIFNKIFQDVEDLADYEIDRLLKHLELKRKTIKLLLLINYLGINSNSCLK